MANEVMEPVIVRIAFEKLGGRFTIAIPSPHSLRLTTLVIAQVF